MWRKISRILRWLLDRTFDDPVIEEQLRKNREALEIKRQNFEQESAVS